MKILGWIVWSIGATAFVCAVGLLVQAIPTGALGRGYGRTLLLFAVCTGVALGGTVATEFSKLHLLWILPVAAVFSLLVGFRSVRRKRDTVAASEVDDQDMSTVNALYFRANKPLTIESVRESFGEFPIEEHKDYIGVRLPQRLGPKAAPKLERMSKLLDTDVMMLGFESAMDCFEFHHWQSGRHIRSLVFGMEDERVWERVDGTPEPWEREFLFDPKNMECELEDAEDVEHQEVIRRVYREGRIDVGQMVPSISSKMTADAIAQHYGFPHYGLPEDAS